MDNIQIQTLTHSTKRTKKRLTQNQVSLLEWSFNYNPKLEPERKMQLSRELGLAPRQVAIWYQNKRARSKTQSLEIDYNTLQQKLDTVLADKRRLEREVGRLRGELEKAHEILLASNPTHPPLSCDEAMNGSSSLAMEELYACLMG
ncbi:hypothetical protein HHK36_003658 [Tetracentron sinense]|uniref:Homeobox-leucine zipper protein n=1 Tax=Tetracentron sinense TaxID=13715 RepID=A0A834ZNN2_TETSI|nr:hypothetical protein HHK36_003658 [Tetracentron sinense]